MKYVLPLMAAAVSTLVGCVSQSSQLEQPVSQASPASSVIQSDAELMTQRLEPGQCGLFLWSRSNTNKFIFFSRAGAATSILMFNGIERNLTQTGIGGEIFGQFLTKTTYQDDVSNLVVTVTIEPGAHIDGGQKVSAGKIMVKDEDGWEAILPIAGTRACMDSN